MRRIATISLIIGTLMVPLQLTAASFDGSVPLLCSVVQIVECGTGQDCFPVTAEMAGIPPFLKIDFKAKTITATEDSGREDVSAIKSIEHIDGKMIMQGSENGRGWTIVISEKTGEMSATVSDDKAGFIVFGASTKD